MICLPGGLRVPLLWTPTFSLTVQHNPLLGLCIYLLSELSATASGIAIFLPLSGQPTNHPRAKGPGPFGNHSLRSAWMLGNIVVAYLAFLWSKKHTRTVPLGFFFCPSGPVSHPPILRVVWWQESELRQSAQTGPSRAHRGRCFLSSMRFSFGQEASLRSGLLPSVVFSDPPLCEVEEDFCEWRPCWHLADRRAGVLSSWLGVPKLCWLCGEGVLQMVGSSVWVGLASGPTGCRDRNSAVCGEGW